MHSLLEMHRRRAENILFYMLLAQIVVLLRIYASVHINKFLHIRIRFPVYFFLSDDRTLQLQPILQVLIRKSSDMSPWSAS